LAEDILNSPIKVESSATKEIMREMKKILDTEEKLITWEKEEEAVSLAG
jgi:hypothetical protein